MAALRFLFADHLSREISSLEGLDTEHDIVLMVEVAQETDYVPHHPKKIAFLFSAMRHFAEELRQEGVQVDYVTLDDPDNQGSFQGELQRAVDRHHPDQIIITEPGEFRVESMMEDWRASLDADIEIRADTRFFCSRAEFAQWAKGKKQLRMEMFYRWMRDRHDCLMTDGEPEGSRWNFDSDNRKPPEEGLQFSGPMRFTPDDITQDVINLVGERFGQRFGEVEPFWFAVNRGQARRALDHFIKRSLPQFGDYQDAMVEGEDYLFHSALSQYLNCGLLNPEEVCRKVEQAYHDGHAPLNAVEGFIRQILGWREYVRGIYWLKMPDYAQENRLNATRNLPDFYWTGDTEMNCLASVIDQTRREAHSHHIQRLMVTGNFALIIGVLPEEICAWYLGVYADAFEWVELPNTLGMVMHADGGFLGSKPYAASGNYINKMSNFCGNCRYRVKEKLGPDACPFNYLYWNFMIENREKLQGNPRLNRPYATLDRMNETRVQAIKQDAATFLENLRPQRYAA